MVFTNALRVAFLAVPAIVLSGCSSEIGKLQSSSLPEGQAPIPIVVNAGSFANEIKQGIYERIRSKAPFRFGDLTQALVKDQYLNWADRKGKDARIPTIEQAYKQIQNLAAEVVQGSDLGKIKLDLETKLLQSRPLVYNSQAISAFDVLMDGKVQSYSGTMLLMLLLREGWGAEALGNSNVVAIYESGHVLPGYLVLIDKVWHLFGVEMTSGSMARVVYGPVNEAVKARMLRIVSAGLFGLVELFKFESDNAIAMTNEALRLTSLQFGIEEPPYLVARFQQESDFKKLAWSPFQFGFADIGLGDRERVKFDERKRSELPKVNPNATVYQKPAPKPDPKPEDKPKDEDEDEDDTDPDLTRVAVKDAVYPFREVKSATGERLFQCWDYRLKTWRDMTHEMGKDENKDKIYILSHPCFYSKTDYTDLPEPLRMRTFGRQYSRPGGYDPDYDPDYGWDD